MVRQTALLLMIFLTACAPRGEITVDPGAGSVGKVQDIFVGSTRNDDGGRSEKVSFGRIDVSVPPNRKPGTISYPKEGQQPNPATDFLVTKEVRYGSGRAFETALRQKLASEPRGNRDIILFVHGYNNTFAEGLYRFAQFSHDLNTPGVEMHFAWPSAGRPLAYVRDRDSAMISRNGLVETIDAAVDSGARQVIIVGHSMGAYLVMESLRQMAISGQRDKLNKIGGVVLMSPDIDVDLFRAQAHDIGKLPEPFLIFASSRDKALNLSAMISREPVRLGTLTDARPISDLKVTLIDNSAFSTGDGHFNAATSPAMISLLSRISQLSDAFQGDGGQVGLFTGAALTVERAAQVVLSPADQLLRR